MTLVDKLLSNIQEQPDGCWMYTGTKDGSGYGQMQCDGVRKRAHVVSYEYHIGPITNGMYVCHRCDRPCCVNPEHLFLGSHTDNVQDMWAKGRGVLQNTQGINNGQATLSDEKVIEIRRLYERGMGQTKIGNMFSIDNSTIWKIVHRKTWRHVA